ncbi:carboxylate--amine ligase [Haladaptatus sp. ZSTT2]|uniref:carboxylate--amine ligase n=1 Tax=Haladaptatus sp. ZSTT2 TaxID=3120515 RepID=UPI00300EBA0D
MGHKVLVLDGQGPNSLALCRTLGQKGVSVISGGYTKYLPGMLSKYTAGSYIHPDVSEDESVFVDHLYEHLASNDYAAVFAVTDVMTTVLSRHKERLESTGTKVGAEDWETHLNANDKKRLFELADGLPIPSPRTFSPQSLADVAEIDKDRDYTVVIKPRRTTFTTDSGQSTTNRMSGVNYVGPEEDLVERFEEIIGKWSGRQFEYPLVQEFIDGVETMATVGLAHEGELVTFFQHKKYRVYPPSGGIGAVRQGTWEPRMKVYADEIVRALDWNGPVHVEFMKMPDGDFYLLEVNGRYWGSLALTINSGVDVPWLHYKQLTGQFPFDKPRAEQPVVATSGGVDIANWQTIPEPEYRTDVKQRKLFYTDIMWLREQLSRNQYQALIPFTTSFFTTRDVFLNLDDPLPFLGLIPRSLKVRSNRKKGISVYDR